METNSCLEPPCKFHAEVHTLRHAVAAVAQAVHALREALDAEAEQRRALEERFAGRLEEIRVHATQMPPSACTHAPTASWLGNISGARGARDLASSLVQPAIGVTAATTHCHDKFLTYVAAGLKGACAAALAEAGDEATLGSNGQLALYKLSKAVRALGAEVASDRHRHTHSEAELAARMSKAEQAQAEAMEHLAADVATACERRRSSEDRSIGSVSRGKQEPLQRSQRERSTGEMPSAREKVLERERQRLQQDLVAWLERRTHEVQDGLQRAMQRQREELCQELSTCLEEQSDGTVARLVASAECSTRELLQCQGESIHMAENVAAANAEHLCEARCSMLKHDMAETFQFARKLKEELCTFMDEQRIFCGYLETEQRSCQEQTRQELSTLSKLVDASLSCDLPAQLAASVPSDQQWGTWE
eukprot:CAMPEP_0172806852 /NCGR_PEP_ID=MMETSP1075-20121228/6624_1 /TAXON_ID=2916 /ORGANISM="Ceratium fusus, Strain PA161109" /LENGTH=420 /DNA_ID=CAMNT_0013645733 /DNA_START=41 /DNA_END=1300 /DNA_ORIENTATION=+